MVVHVVFVVLPWLVGVYASRPFVAGAAGGVGGLLTAADLLGLLFAALVVAGGVEAVYLAVDPVVRGYLVLEAGGRFSAVGAAVRYLVVAALFELVWFVGVGLSLGVVLSSFTPLDAGRGLVVGVASALMAWLAVVSVACFGFGAGSVVGGVVYGFTVVLVGLLYAAVGGTVLTGFNAAVLWWVDPVLASGVGVPVYSFHVYAVLVAVGFLVCLVRLVRFEL